METEPLSDSIELEPDLPPGQEPEEGGLTRRVIKRTASAQGSTVPQGWKPSIRQPVPVVRCSYHFKDTHPRAGEQCENWSMRGSLLCYAHSGRGNLKNVEEYRQAVLEAARLRLTESVPMALDVLFDLAQHSGADNVRLKAVENILDRTGIKMATEIDVTVNDVSGQDPAQTLSDRLGKLRVAAEQVREAREKSQAHAEQLALEASVPVVDTDAEVIEGEVVEE